MSRVAFVHEHTRYEVLIRGVQSRAEAEAIVKAVEALPVASAWIPPEVPDESALPPFVQADADDNVGGLLAGTAVEP